LADKGDNTLLLVGLLLLGGYAYSKGYLNPLLSKLNLPSLTGPITGTSIDEDLPGQSLTVPSPPGIAATASPPPTLSAPVASANVGAFVPVLNKDLAPTIQQANKYKLLPGTEGKPPAGPQLYQLGGKRRVATGNYESGSQGASDGIRANIINMPDLVNREVTWIFTVHEIRETKGKDHYGPKCGSHSDGGSALYTNSVEYNGGPLKFQQEAPHGRYVKCSNFQQITPAKALWPGKTAYPVKVEKRVGIKFVQWGIGGGSQHIEVWHDYDHGGLGPYTKIGQMDDKMPGNCQGPPVGYTGRIQAPQPGNGNYEDTMRVNGGVVTWHAMSIMEIAPPAAPRTSGFAGIVGRPSWPLRPRNYYNTQRRITLG
jgi:hypothetical protein